jgi:hypothetical protein
LFSIILARWEHMAENTEMLEKKVTDWMGEKDWNALRHISSGAESAISTFEKAVGDKGLARSLALLYFAEMVPKADSTTKQIAYLSAMLFFEGYMAGVKFDSRNENVQKPFPPETERYIGICNELSDYCRNKVSYFAKEPGRAE